MDTIKPMAERCVGTMADLKALAPGVAPCLLLLGYNTPGDGGGGSFYWHGASTERDNVGTIIAPDTSLPAGRWKRLIEGPLSVRWFGARGDGVAPDETSAVQAAIDAAIGVKGTVLFPARTYLCGNLTVPNAVR